MTCDNCHQRPAKYHVTRVVNGERSEEDLCEECALEKGELALHLQTSTALHDLLAGLLEGSSPPRLRASEQEQQQCPACGLTRAEFARTGLLGCESCYTVFAETLRPLVRRVQGAGHHHGKVPARARRAPAGRAGAGEAARAASSPRAEPGAGAPANPGGPARLQVASLREELHAAIAAEEFERAAALRDRIRALEGRTRDGQA